MGHLKGIDGEQIWKDILNKKFKNYSDKIAVSQITITKPSILNRFKKMNSGKPLSKQIKPFNFMLTGSEINGVIPCLPYSKDLSGIEYRSFTDYRTGLTSDNLPLPSTEYWKSLEDVLTAYVRHSDGKFDYTNNIAQRKHIVMDKVRYIGKESNNLDEVNTFGGQNDSVLEYHNLKEFCDWVLLLKPKDVRAEGISQQSLYYQKSLIRTDKNRNFHTKVVQTLWNKYRFFRVSCG